MDKIEKKKLDKLLSEISPTFFSVPEVVKQFKNHQRFLISGLDNKEEFRSRLAFTDAYKNEFEEIHEKLRNAYGLPKGEHEFDYLSSEQFRTVTDKDKSVVFDMMKDYLSYKHIKGEISEERYKDVLSAEPEAERKFRDQKLTEKESEFLIDQSAFDPAKQQGLRECRKWMYRNCSKSGALNETGTKRNYIDSFGKRPVAEQINTLYQVEKGYYKFKEKGEKQEKPAMDESYVPSLKGFKDKMVRGRVNPYRWWKKATGDMFYWTRMERGLKKTEEAKEEVAAEYENQKKRFADAQKLQRAEAVREEDVPQYSKEDQEFFDSFQKASKKYMKALDKYAEKRSEENYKALMEQGLKVQRMYKENEKNPFLESNPEARSTAREFAEYTRQMEKEVRKMPINEIQMDKVEKHFDKTADLGISIKDKVGLAYTGAKKIAELAGKTSDVAEGIATGAAIFGAVTSGYTMLKNFGMAIKSNSDQKKAMAIKQKNKENRKTSAELEAMDPNSKEFKDAKDAQQINDMAKVSKNRNNIKKKAYAVAGVCAGASCALGITGVACTVGLPVTIAAGVVAGIGFGAGYAMNIVSNKNPAKKSVDSAMKLEDKDYEKQTDAEGKKKRYIDTKMEERRDMIEDKQGRFRAGTDNRENVDYYLKNPGKLKDRIRTNFAVEHGSLTMYTFRDAKDRDNANIAYRHVFLKDPDGPINEENLLGPDDVKQYMSQKKEDLMITGQTAKEAEKRETYMQLLKSEGFSVKNPKNVTEAQQLFSAADPKKETTPKTPENAELDALDKQVHEAEKDRKKMMSAQKGVLNVAKTSADLLKRLEKAGEGKDKKGYQRMKTALEKASALDEHSTPAQVRQCLKSMYEAGAAYTASHSGAFQGIIGSGKERAKIAHLSVMAATDTLNDFARNAKGMDNKKSIAQTISQQDKKLEDMADERKGLTGEKQRQQERADQKKQGVKALEQQRQQQAPKQAEKAEKSIKQ